MAELQKDRMTRKDFVGFGIMGTVMGALITIPAAGYLLGPIIDVDALGQSDVSGDWQEVGAVADIPMGKPKDFTVEFPIQQIYSSTDAQKQHPETPRSTEQSTLKNAIYVSWKAPIKKQGRQGNSGDVLGDQQRPSFLDSKREGFTQEERREAESKLNVLSNSCAHLGCPVRWLQSVDGKGEFLCPCHGGIYDINGGWVGGPPPRGMYRYTQTQVREDGKLYVKHGFSIEKGIPGLTQTAPYVV